MALSDTLLISMGLLTIAIIASGLFRKVSIPYTVILVIIGIALSEFSTSWHILTALDHFKLTPELVFFIFLPALIFESGLNLNARVLIKNLAPVLTLAVPALLISTGIIGLGIWLILDIDLTIALLFGALISATDPVAVVALFKEIGAPMRLNVLVEGESLFNDATAIVVFGILVAMVVSGEALTVMGVGEAAVDFIWVFLGGTVVGTIIGLIISEIMSRLHIDRSGILTLSLVMAYSSFIIAEHVLHVSGVMATVTAAITLGSFGINRLPIGSEDSLEEIWEFIALVANSLLFLLVGLSIELGHLLEYAGAISIAVILVIAARAATVYSLVPMTTRFFRLPVVTKNEQHIMWWGGLKGGLAIAIVLSIPETVGNREMLITLTLGVVLFTLLINASTIRPLMRRLKMDQMTADEISELHQGYQIANNRAIMELQQFSHNQLLNADQLNELQDKIERQLHEEFQSEHPDLAKRRTYLLALQTELDTLDELFHHDLIKQYTYLDIRNTLMMDRERHDQTTDSRALPMAKISIFVKLEHYLLHWLSERNWTSSFLKKYQHNRLNQRLQRDIAGVILCNAVLEQLKQAENLDPDETEALRQLYQSRLDRRKGRLEEIKQSFPEFFNQYEDNVYSRAALVAAMNKLEQALHHGQIGNKAYQRIASQLDDLIENLSESDMNAGQKGLFENIQHLKLFENLSFDAIQLLKDRIHEVTYLKNDTIIKASDKVEALYIIWQGKVSVQSNDEHYELSENDYFGHSTRDKSKLAKPMLVSALIPTTLYRLTLKDINKLSQMNNELKNLFDGIK